MRRTLLRPVILAFLAMALISLPPVTAKEYAVSAQGIAGEVYPSVSLRGQIVRRKRPRRGAIGAGGAGVYKVKSKRRGQKRRPIRKRPVWDDTDIVH
jgi:hypothetical protein